MVRWSHAIFTAYGFWLPNDPRGSWSTFVASWNPYRFGPATKTLVRASVAHVEHDSAQRREAKTMLRYPPVRFDEQPRQLIAAGIAQACRESDITVLAYAIGYDHVHAIVARHAKPITRIVGQFKGRARQQLLAAGRHPYQAFIKPDDVPPSPWSERSWSVFISDEAHFRQAVHYVRSHPMKEGLPPQTWDFVTPE